MTWIEDDYEELKRLRLADSELKVREAEIASQAEAIYNALWSEIAERVSEAKTRKVTTSSLITNGAAFHRSLIVTTIPDGKRSVYGLALAADKQSVIFMRPEGNIVLPLVLGEDGVTRLSHEGEHRLVDDVARSLLRPIIFPELYDTRKLGLRNA